MTTQYPKQLKLFDLPDENQSIEVDFSDYDYVILAFSGGKDSLACLLWLLESGCPKPKIEIWHHDVDASLEGEPHFVDWHCTISYCRAIAQYFDIPLYFSWRTGGFRREMLRDNTPTASVKFETPEGLVETGGKSNRLGKRLLFPQQSGKLSNRWCTPYLKIAVSDAAIANQPRFKGKKTLFLSGERAEESPARAKYENFELHRKNAKSRIIHHLRPVHRWDTQTVWDAIARWKLMPHPAYWWGFGRTSCRTCIFIKDEDWATLGRYTPEVVSEVAQYEKSFGVAIARSGTPVDSRVRFAGEGRKVEPLWVAQAEEFTLPVEVSGEWVYPPGAFGDLTSGSW